MPYQQAVERLIELLRRARAAGFDPHWVNAGGGFAVSYDGSPVPDPEAYAVAILPRLAQEGVKLVLEIGRAIVGDAGGLLTRVLYRKEQGDRRLLITDAGMNDLMRPALYGRGIAYAVNAPQERTANTSRRRAGPICESSFTGGDRALRRPAGTSCRLRRRRVRDVDGVKYNSHPTSGVMSRREAAGSGGARLRGPGAAEWDVRKGGGGRWSEGVSKSSRSSRSIATTALRPGYEPRTDGVKDHAAERLGPLSG